jgi:hypothetical protein
LSPAGFQHTKSELPSIFRLRGGIESTKAPIDDVEFSLGEVDPSSSADKSKNPGPADQTTKVQACDDSEAHFPDDDDDRHTEARVIDCTFSHIGDKNGVIYYLGKSMT